MKIQRDADIPQFPTWGYASGTNYVPGWWTRRGKYVYLIRDGGSGNMCYRDISKKPKSKKIFMCDWIEIDQAKIGTFFTREETETIEQFRMESLL